MNRTYIDVPLQILEAKEAGVDELSSEHDLDVLNIRFKLVYAGVNNNGDRFTDDILRANYRSLVHKLINWEHDEPNIGVITKAKLVEPAGEVPLHVECDGTIMRIKYPEYAEMIANSAGFSKVGLSEANDKSIAKMSMEAYFHDADYVIGDYEQIIPMKDDRTGMMAQLLGKTIGGKLVSRELKDCVFAGAAVTVNPAEKRAVLMAAASNKTQDGGERYKDLTEAEFAMASRRIFPIDTTARVLASYEYFDEVARLIDKEYHTAPELVEAHRIIQDRLSEAGLSDIVHNCRICEGGIEDMGGKTKNTEASEQEVIETPETEIDETGPAVETIQAEDVEEAPTDSEVITEPNTLDEPSNETEDEVEPEAELEVVVDAIDESEPEDDAVLTESIGDVTALLTEIRDLLNVVNQASASESVDEEVEDLKTKLAEATNRAETAENSVLGMKRVLSLVSEGLTTYASLNEKSSRYGAMENSTWLSYVEDLRSVKKSDVPDEKPKKVEASKTDVEEDIPLILESVEEQDPVKNYRGYVMAIKQNIL